jgi:hypothetical protein
MSTATAFSAFGSDIALSVSFGIANELLDAAHEAHLSEEELIAVVLVLSVVLSALPSAFRSLWLEVGPWRSGGRRKAQGGARAAAPVSGVVEFLTLLLRMGKRISVSICVQLLASNVRSRQPLRSVRVLSLLAVSVFFLFLESTGSAGSPSAR